MEQSAICTQTAWLKICSV